MSNTSHQQQIFSAILFGQRYPWVSHNQGVISVGISTQRYPWVLRLATSLLPQTLCHLFCRARWMIIWKTKWKVKENRPILIRAINHYFQGNIQSLIIPRGKTVIGEVVNYFFRYWFQRVFTDILLRSLFANNKNKANRYARHNKRKMG